MKINMVIFSLLLLFSASCASDRMPANSSARGPVIVYKTVKDYSGLVTVKLSDDGKTITAFPAPSDAIRQRPFELEDGYLLKRMVGDAYLSLSIDEYTSGERSYSSDELLELVIDTNPYLEIYECSACTSGDTASINQIIREGKLKKCNSLQ